MAAIPIIFYKNSVPLNHNRRTLSDPLQILGTPREAINLLRPEITVEYNAVIMSYNYAYIAEYNRYYSFSELPTVEGKTLKISLKADTFWNWKNIIMKSQCIAERSSSLYELMLEDTAVSAVAGYDIYSRSLPYEFRADMGRYVLIVAGG